MHVYGMMHAERTRAGDSVFLISYPLIISNLVPRYGNYRGARKVFFAFFRINVGHRLIRRSWKWPRRL